MPGALVTTFLSGHRCNSGSGSMNSSGPSAERAHADREVQVRPRAAARRCRRRCRWLARLDRHARPQVLADAVEVDVRGDHGAALVVDADEAALVAAAPAVLGIALHALDDAVVRRQHQLALAGADVDAAVAAARTPRGACPSRAAPKRRVSRSGSVRSGPASGWYQTSALRRSRPPGAQHRHASLERVGAGAARLRAGGDDRRRRHRRRADELAAEEQHRQAARADADGALPRHARPDRRQRRQRGGARRRRRRRSAARAAGSDAFVLARRRAERAHLAVDDQRRARAQRVVLRRADRAGRRDNPHAGLSYRICNSRQSTRWTRTSDADVDAAWRAAL